MTVNILTETKSYLVLDKPAGMIVNRAETTAGRETLQDWLEVNFNWPIFNCTNLRHGIVHRLDKDTSGILLVAKTKEAMEALQAQFKKRQVLKTYLTLVHGRVALEKGDIRAPIGRNPVNRQRFGVFIDGKSAVTEYQVVTRFIHPQTKQPLTLLQAYPKTGRTHQLRVHFKHLNHTLVSDPWYNGRKILKHDLSWCPRLFLHAAEISFKDLDTHKPVTVKSLLPKELDSVLNYLKKADKTA